MAITNTRTVERIEVMPSGDDPIVTVFYIHTFDDSTDDQLPVASTVVKSLLRNTTTVDDEGVETTIATDVTGEDQLVQDVCGAVWTD